jgi:hypothetical protein
MQSTLNSPQAAHSSDSSLPSSQESAEIGFAGASQRGHRSAVFILGMPIAVTSTIDQWKKPKSQSKRMIGNGMPRSHKIKPRPILRLPLNDCLSTRLNVKSSTEEKKADA